MLSGHSPRRATPPPTASPFRPSPASSSRSKARVARLPAVSARQVVAALRKIGFEPVGSLNDWQYKKCLGFDTMPQS